MNGFRNNFFKKLEDDLWGVAVKEGNLEGDEHNMEGKWVVVTKANGETKNVKLGKFYGTDDYENYLYEMAPFEKPAENVNTYRKLPGDMWGIATGKAGMEGELVTVTKANGETKEAVLAEFIGEMNGRFVYMIGKKKKAAKKAAKKAKPLPVREGGGLELPAF